METIFYGNTVKDWAISLLIIVAALILNKIIVLLNRNVIKKITVKTKNRMDDILFSTLESPVLLGIMLLAIWIAVNRLSLDTAVHVAIGKAYHALIILNVTWFVGRFANALLEEHVRKIVEREKLKNRQADTKLIPLVRRIIVMIVWGIGIVMALNNIGVSVGALLGTLGIGGIAIALAAQDTVKNIIGGITIFTDQPFRIGDRIRFDNIDGFVEDIGIRSTRIRTLDKRLVTIPNYKIVDADIENITSEPGRRVVLNLSLKYETKPEKLKEAIAILKAIPQTVTDVRNKDISATFSNFGDYSLVITYIYFIKRNAADVMESISKVNMEILTQFNEANVEFAYPTQTVYTEK